MSPADASLPDRPGGLLLSRDLIFTAKITGTAGALGRFVTTAGNAALAGRLIAEWRPAVVILDLAAGDLVRPDAISTYRGLAPGTPFIAFGSHVETATLEAAKAAGCDVVLPRSRFTAELAELIERYLPAAAPPG